MKELRPRGSTSWCRTKVFTSQHPHNRPVGNNYANLLEFTLNSAFAPTRIFVSESNNRLSNFRSNGRTANIFVRVGPLPANQCTDAKPTRFLVEQEMTPIGLLTRNEQAVRTMPDRTISFEGDQPGVQELEPDDVVRAARLDRRLRSFW